MNLKIKLNSVLDAAEKLEMTVRGIRLACERGVLAAEKVGNIWVIPEESIIDYKLHHRNKRGRKSRKPEQLSLV